MASGFASFSGGFGAAAKTGGGLTSFAAPCGSSLLNSTSAKPFGAADDDEKEDDEEEDEAEKGPGEFEQDKTDERFFERESMSPIHLLFALVYFERRSLTCNSRNR